MTADPGRFFAPDAGDPRLGAPSLLVGALNRSLFFLSIKDAKPSQVVYLLGEPNDCLRLSLEHGEEKQDQLLVGGVHNLTWRGHATNDLGEGTEVSGVHGGLKACSDFVMQRHAESVHHARVVSS
jgi:hypothetical protein